MNSKDWNIPYTRPFVPQALLDAGYTPLLAAVMALRGVQTREQAQELLYGDVQALPDPMLMAGMADAVKRVHLAVERGEKVAVFGDYDVDGITSTCLLTDYLRRKGLLCRPYIPDRAGEGYGLNVAALDTLVEDGVSLLITVDCGITAVEEAAYARAHGMDIIITDHHECPGGALPEASAVVDCKQDNDLYPNKNLAGVGVALKLVCACEGESGEMLRRYADLVAIGTIADVMPLTGENRYLVRTGIESISANPRPGIAAMLREASVDAKKLTASTVSFTLAPRLNASGRLGHAFTAAKLLMTENPSDAASLAAELCELNRKRQAIELSIWNEANASLAGETPELPIVLASSDWHQGVIGIAASRLAEQYSLPAIMICLNGDVGKGSCRSYGNFNLFEALSACSEYLIGFGGHALAAGLNIRRDRLDDFRRALGRFYVENRPAAVPEVQCDLLINDPSLLSIENVRSLDMLEPFGNANAKPLICISGAKLESLSAVGGGKHLRMRVSLKGEQLECIFFSHTAEGCGISEGDSIDLAFVPQINEYRGHVSVQLLVSAARLHNGLELCRGILDGDKDVFWAAAPYLGSRGDFARVWHSIDSPAFCVGMTAEDIIRQRPDGISPERFCICLTVLLQAGLLAPGDGGCIYGAKIADYTGKADLEATELMKMLRHLS